MATECTCRGLKILKNMTNFYTDEILQHVRDQPKSKLHYDRAKNISNMLYNKLTEPEKTIKYNVSERVKRNADINRFKRGCDEGIRFECIAQLEMLRQVLHNDSDAREKLICTENPEKYKAGFRGESPLSNDIKRLIGRLFTGDFIDQDEGKIIYNPYKSSINKSIREECDKMDI